MSDKIVDVIEGCFWVSGSEEQKERGRVNLYEDRSFDIFIESPFSKDNSIYEGLVLGESDKGNKISLSEVSYKKKILSSSEKEESILTAPIFVQGRKHVADIKLIDIKSFDFYITNCDSWFYEDRILEEMKYDTLNKKEVVLKYDENTEIVIYSAHCFKKGYRVTKASIKSPMPRRLAFFQEVAHSLITFLSFATSRIVGQIDYRVKDSEENEFELSYRPSFYQHGGSFCENRVLFSYKYERIADMFLKWVGIREKSEPVLGMYFMPMLRAYDSTVNYIILTQVLECINRKLNEDNKMTFINRVQDMVSNGEYSDIILKYMGKDVEKFCETVRDTRNYFTHYNPEKEQEASKGKELLFLCMRVKLLIELFLLQKIGFNKHDFEKIESYVIDDWFNRQSIIENLSCS